MSDLEVKFLQSCSRLREKRAIELSPQESPGETPGLELGTFGRDRPLQPAPSKVNGSLAAKIGDERNCAETTIRSLAEFLIEACSLETTRPEKPNPPVEKVAWRTSGDLDLAMAAGAWLGITVKSG